MLTGLGMSMTEIEDDLNSIGWFAEQILIIRMLWSISAVWHRLATAVATVAVLVTTSILCVAAITNNWATGVAILAVLAVSIFFFHGLLERYLAKMSADAPDFLSRFMEGDRLRTPQAVLYFAAHGTVALHHAGSPRERHSYGQFARTLALELPRALRRPDATAVKMMFATNREVEPGSDLRFSGERSLKVTYGTATVSIPKEHKFGRIERPAKIRLFGFFGPGFSLEREDVGKHFVVTSCSKMEPDSWASFASGGGSDTALVYVHGYRVRFDDAVIQLAQLHFDLNLDMAPILFSWPSRGQLANYWYDRASADASGSAFLDMLRCLGENREIRRVHILAHSMGNQLVLDALKGSRAKGVGEYVLAAPDVDKHVFFDAVPRVRRRVAGMTLYASAHDKALMASRTLAGSIGRAGQVLEDGPLVVPGVETIDVSALGADFLGHSEYGKQRSIMTDLRLLLQDGKRPPHDRVADIRPVPHDPPHRYWRYF